MGLSVGWLAIDTHDPGDLAPFYEELLGLERVSDTAGAVALEAPDPGRAGIRGLLLLAVDDDKVVKNRVHLDLVADGGTGSGTTMSEEVDRALGLGATRADVGQDEDVPWVVLADPHGNEFCIVPTAEPDAYPGW